MASVAGGEDDALIASGTHGDESTEPEGNLVQREIGERFFGGESGSDLPDLAIGGGEGRGAVPYGNKNFGTFWEGCGAGGDG